MSGQRNLSFHSTTGVFAIFFFFFLPSLTQSASKQITKLQHCSSAFHIAGSWTNPNRIYTTQGIAGYYKVGGIRLGDMVLKMSYRQSSLTSRKIVFVSLSLSNPLFSVCCRIKFPWDRKPFSALKIPHSKCKAIIHWGEKMTAWLTGKDMVGLEDNERWMTDW